jgi:hypothetical protein
MRAEVMRGGPVWPPRMARGLTLSRTRHRQADCRSIEEMRLVNALCRFVELARVAHT